MVDKNIYETDVVEEKIVKDNKRDVIRIFKIISYVLVGLFVLYLLMHIFFWAVLFIISLIVISYIKNKLFK